MRIHTQQIHPEGLELEESFPAESVGLNEEDVFKFVAPVNVVANVTRTDDEIFASINADSRYASSCSRCLEEVKQDWTARFTIILDVDKHKEFIELDEDIRQELILNLPDCILCREDCKGLCVDCGANLNNQQCEHKSFVIASEAKQSQ